MLFRSMMKLRIPILANGMFLEVLVAHFLSPFKGAYSCKIPGDIVWERARNSGFTQLNIDEFQEKSLPIKYRLLRNLFTLSLTKANSVIVPSSHLKKLAKLWGVQDGKLYLIFNSIDQNLYSGHPHADKEFDVITVCRLVPWKGVDELVRSCAELGLSLAVVGDGPERENLESLSKSLKANVFFYGDKSQTEIPNILNKARAFVLNSSFEATSYALIEARSMGLFSIARKNTGSDEVIHHGIDGILCDDNELNLTNSLKLFEQDYDFVSQAIGKAQEDSRARFSQDLNFMKIFDLVEKAVV
mgnify:CR=1 FL=1